VSQGGRDDDFGLAFLSMEIMIGSLCLPLTQKRFNLGGRI
jgi:hypothetical protein